MPEFVEATPGPEEPVSITVEGDPSESERAFVERMTEVRVPENTQLSDEMYRHLAVRGAEDRARLVSWAARRVYTASPREDAEDLVQDIFLELMNKSLKEERPFARPASSIAALFSIGGFMLKAARGRGRRRTENEFSYGDLPFKVENGLASDDVYGMVEASLYGNDLNAIFNAVWGGLAPQRRKALLALRDNPDISRQGLAAAMGGVTPSTASVTKSHIFGMLRKRADDLEQRGFLTRSGPAFDLAAGPKTAPVKRGVKVTNLQSKALRMLNDYRDAGETFVALDAAPYAGPWSIAAQDMRARIRKADSVQASGLVVYPHETLLPEFRRYMQGLLGEYAAQVTIVTPSELDALSLSYYDSVTMTEEIPAELDISLRQKAGFILRLLHGKSTRLFGNIYSLPSYREAGGPWMKWAPDDSIRYMQEQRFVSGKALDAQTADVLAASGQGPTARRLTHGIGSFIAVWAAAGYPCA